MADKILHKRSLISGTIPTTASLSVGELAINVADGKLYIRQSSSLSDNILIPRNHQITTGSITAQVDVNTLFLIKSGSIDLFKIQSDKVAVFSTQSVELSNPAPNGGIYFTSSSLWIGLD